MKHFECGSLVPGCTWHISAEETSEVVRREVEHLKAVHGETDIRPAMIDRIKQRITELEPAR